MVQYSTCGINGDHAGGYHAREGKGSAGGSRFLPDLHALLDRVEDLFRRNRSQRARALRNQINEGVSGLTDCEILQLALDPVSEGRNTSRIAKALLRRFRTFGGVVNAPAKKLMAVDGVGEAGAAALKTLGAAAIHMLRKVIGEDPILDTSDGVKNYLIANLQHEQVEVLFILYLDGDRRLIECKEMWRGTINEVPIYPREVIEHCLGLGATAVVIAHNHPNGTLHASYGDIAMTENIVSAADVFGITVVDHLIVGRGGETVSMRKEGLL